MMLQPCRCECAAKEAAQAGADKYGRNYFALCIAVKVGGLHLQNILRLSCDFF